VARIYLNMFIKYRYILIRGLWSMSIILLLSKYVSAHFFFHGPRVGRWYNIIFYTVRHLLVLRSCRSWTTPPRLIIDGIDYRTFSPPRQASPWATVLFIYRAPRISAACFVLVCTVPSTSDASDLSTWRCSRGDGRQCPEQLASPETDRPDRC